MILLFDLLCKINWEKAIRLCLHKPLEAPTNPQKHGVLPHQIHSSSPHLWNSDPSGQLRWPQRHRLAQHGPNRPTLGRANDGLFSLMFSSLDVNCWLHDLHGNIQMRGKGWHPNHVSAPGCPQRTGDQSLHLAFKPNNGLTVKEGLRFQNLYLHINLNLNVLSLSLKSNDETVLLRLFSPWDLVLCNRYKFIVLLLLQCRRINNIQSCHINSAV